MAVVGGEGLLMLWILLAIGIVLVGLVGVFVLIIQTIFGKRRLWSVENQVTLCLVSLLVYGLLFIVPPMIDAQTNIVLSNQEKFLPKISSEAAELHKTLWISDLHADSLLWPQRDLNKPVYHGHVDIPRLLEGNVALQAFTIVTAAPMGQNFDENPEPSTWTDKITLKAVIERWGLDTITSLAARTLFQAELFDKIIRQSEGTVFPIRFKEDLKHYMDIRVTNNITAGFLGIEGLHALDGDINNLNRFFDAGIRMVAASCHFFDNDIGGSAHGIEKYGLTDLGKLVVRKAQEMHMLLDVAHASESVIDDIVELATLPVLSSHTGCRAICNVSRNIGDEHIKAIAGTGGVLGIAYFKPSQCGDNLLDSIVKSILHVKDLVGVEHVGLGSDFDGTVQVPFDTSNLAYITEALLRKGISHNDIRLIMGGNIQRILLQSLPSR